MPKLKEITVFTKKHHNCEICGWMIPKGSLCRYIVALECGVFKHGWFHNIHFTEEGIQYDH